MKDLANLGDLKLIYENEFVLKKILLTKAELLTISEL